MIRWFMWATKPTIYTWSRFELFVGLLWVLFILWLPTDGIVIFVLGLWMLLAALFAASQVRSYYLMRGYHDED